MEVFARTPIVSNKNKSVKMRLKVGQLLMIVLLTSCEGPEGLNSLVETIDESAGSNCKNGRIKIISGSDKNNNAVLDQNEIISTKFICNGENGASSLLTSVVEAPGVNCSKGGIKIEFGKDLDANGQLSSSEIEQTRYVCNGEAGVNTLVNMTNQPLGAECQYGGVKIETGKDSNANGVLDASEIEQRKYVCDGMDGEEAKEIRFDLSGVNGNHGPSFGQPESTIPVISKSELILFNKALYSSYDSVVFVIENIKTWDLPSLTPTSTGNAIFELYDLTNNQAISNTKVVSNAKTRIISKNINPFWPQGTIDVGLKISSENNNFVSFAGPVYLLLIKD